MAQTSNVTPLFNDLAKAEHEHRIACQECALFRLCLPLGLHSNDLQQLDKIIQRSQSINRGELLFSADSAFTAIYVVRSGSFKTTIQTADGREQVTGFYFPGEFIGMDAIYENAHKSSAKALESSSVCALPYERLQELGTQMPQLQVQMMTRLSKELSSDKSMMLMLGRKSAEEKLASLLVSLSKRFKDRGFSATDFHLSMTRGDIGNHLGLAVETVSRLFTRFHDEGLINIDGKTTSISDIDKLRELCG
jgi:CRP/FNR family transcriptional regulator